MAFRLGDAVLFFGGDTKELDKSVEGSQSKVATFGSKVTGVLGGAVVGATAAVVAGIAAIGTAAFDVSADTEEAARQIEASLGTSRAEAERLAEAARGVFGANYAENVQEAGAAVALLSKHMEDVVGQEEKLTKKAFGISDAFEEPIEEVIKAAGTLQQEFDDLSPDQAFDLIAAGFQKGLNKSDDFLDSIGEYSNLFAQSGFAADQFFSLMQTGAAGGVLGTDKIADAMKEFGIRVQEGTKDASAALDELGLSAADTFAGLSDGSLTIEDVFGRAIAELEKIEDPLERNRLQVALFGTQAEDLGQAFVQGLSAARTSLADMEGAADSLNVQYDSLKGALAAIWRETIVGVSPVTDSLLDLANGAIPTVREAARGLTALLTGDWSTAWDTAKSLATGAVEGISTAFDDVVETAKTTWNNLVNAAPGLYEDLKTEFEGTDWGAIGTALMDTISAAVDTA